MKAADTNSNEFANQLPLNLKKELRSYYGELKKENYENLSKIFNDPLVKVDIERVLAFANSNDSYLTQKDYCFEEKMPKLLTHEVLNSIIHIILRCLINVTDEDKEFLDRQKIPPFLNPFITSLYNDPSLTVYDKLFLLDCETDYVDTSSDNKTKESESNLKSTEKDNESIEPRTASEIVDYKSKQYDNNINIEINPEITKNLEELKNGIVSIEKAEPSANLACLKTHNETNVFIKLDNLNEKNNASVEDKHSDIQLPASLNKNNDSKKINLAMNTVISHNVQNETEVCDGNRNMQIVKETKTASGDISIKEITDIIVPSEENVVKIRRSLRAPTIEDFTPISYISKGGYGCVIKVFHKRIKNKVFAIKILRKSDIIRKNQIERIKMERDILSTISRGSSGAFGLSKKKCERINEILKQTVVRFYFSFRSRTHLFMVLDYMSGGDVGDLLETCGSFTEDMARQYIAEILLALEALHSLEIIHRDIKPENLLIASTGHIKLTDFGVSKLALVQEMGNRTHENDQINTAVLSVNNKPQHNNTTTQLVSSNNCNNDVGNNGLSAASNNIQQNTTGLGMTNSIDTPPSAVNPENIKNVLHRQRAYSIVGTPHYLAPEIIDMKGHDYSCDMWSLGIVLFEFLFGTRPFYGETTDEIFDMIRKEDIVNLFPDWKPGSPDNEFSKEISDEARDLIMKLLKKDPSERITIRSMKKHPWFVSANYDWKNVFKQKAAWIPCEKKEDETKSLRDAPDGDWVQYVLQRVGFEKDVNEKAQKKPTSKNSSSSSSSKLLIAKDPLADFDVLTGKNNANKGSKTNTKRSIITDEEFTKMAVETPKTVVRTGSSNKLDENTVKNEEPSKLKSQRIKSQKNSLSDKKCSSLHNSSESKSKPSGKSNNDEYNDESKSVFSDFDDANMSAFIEEITELEIDETNN